MNTTLIRTARGKSILIQHDITSPRPYNRLHTISGTKGFAQKYPIRSLAFDPDAHHRLSDEQLDQMLRRYEHPITREIGEKAREVGGHGGMDFIMDYRLVYCLRHGLPLDQDVIRRGRVVVAGGADRSVGAQRLDACRDARLHARRMAQGRGLLATGDGRVTPAAPNRLRPCRNDLRQGRNGFEGQDYLSACNTRGISSERVFSVWAA